MLLVAVEASDFADQVFEALRTWSSLGLLETFVFNDAREGGTELRSRLVANGVVREEPLDHLLANYVGDLTIHWVTICAEQPEEVVLKGGTSAKLVLEATSQMVSTLQALKRLRILVADRSTTTFQDLPEDGWPYRIFLVPEDRARSDALSNLVAERLIAHVAAGLCALGGLWPSPRTALMPDVTEWITDDQHGNEPDTVWLVRQFTRIVELPTLYNKLLDGTTLEEDSYPNPDQEKFERVDLSDQVAGFAKVFVEHFEELQPAKPDLVHEDPPAKRTLRHALADLISYTAHRIVQKPFELLDDALGKLYDKAAGLVEGAFPGNTVSVERWREMGQDPSLAPHAVADLVKASDRLIESDLGRVWEEYWRLCTSLIDGGDSVGVLGDQLFLTTKDRRQISGSPSCVVRDPTGALVECPSTRDPKPSDATTETATTSENGSAEDRIAVAPISAVDAPSDEVSGGTPEAAESIGDEPVTAPISATPSSGADAILDVIDPSFTGHVRQIIEGSFNKESEKLTAIELAHAQASVQSPLAPEASAKHGWFYRLFHRKKSSQRGGVAQLARATTRSIWRALILGFAVTIGGTIFLVVEHYPLWAIVWLVAMLFFTMVNVLFQAFHGWRRERIAVKGERDQQMAFINEVITEATTRRNKQSLIRRLGEVIDWNHIVGVVVHHPWRFNQSLVTQESTSHWQLPLSVVRAEAVLEGPRIQALQHQFNGFLFQKGWLSARFTELENRALQQLLEASGRPDEGSLRMIEGDTSLDPDSPRRQFARLVEATLLSEGGDPDLRTRVNEFLGDSRPLGQLITEVKEYDPEQDVLASEGAPIGEFFSSVRRVDGGFVAAHWLEGCSEGESEIDSSLVLGDGEDSTIIIRTGIESEHEMPARILCVSLQKSRRIGTTNLQAFQPGKANP